MSGIWLKGHISVQRERESVKAAEAELEITVDVFNFHFSLTYILSTGAAASKLASMIPLKPQDTHTHQCIAFRML